MYNLIVNTKLFPPTLIRCEYACTVLSAFKRRFDTSSMLPRLGISYRNLTLALKPRRLLRGYRGALASFEGFSPVKYNFCHLPNTFCMSKVLKFILEMDALPKSVRRGQIPH